MRACISCKLSKPENQFRRLTSGQGRGKRCVACAKALERRNRDRRLAATLASVFPNR